MAKEKKEGYLASIVRRDPAARSRFYVLLFYPCVKALFWFRVAHFFEKKIHFHYTARFIMGAVRWRTGIEIHPGATIGKHLFIDHGAGVVIGETAIIGDDVLMYHNVTLGGKSFEKIKRHPTVGNRVIIGSGATLIGDITIGDDSKIATGANIRHDVPPFTLAINDDKYIPLEKEK